LSLLLSCDMADIQLCRPCEHRLEAVWFPSIYERKSDPVLPDTARCAHYDPALPQLSRLAP
jgi:hypothetical protein